jgi:DNA-binding NtrC family response regulator
MHLSNLSYFSSGARSLQSNRGGRTILLVDDNLTVLTLLETMLTKEGYRVVSAANPLAALNMATQTTFDMLVTDFEMPGMDGFTLATHLAETRTTLPVLLISGAGPERLPMHELNARHWNFLPKPVDRERLLHMIDADCLGWAVKLDTGRQRRRHA